MLPHTRFKVQKILTILTVVATQQSIIHAACVA